MTQPAPSNDDALLSTRDEAGIATLTLNRPGQYNALSEELLGELAHALDDIAQDRAIRVVVLAGSGKAFCAGHDLKQMRARPTREYYEKLFSDCSRVMLAIQRLPQPVIARVHGIAAAAGCQLVATCDLAVASTEARFAVSGINVGLFCSTPSVALSRNIPRKSAFEMLFTGEFIDAPTALAKGLVNRVTSPDSLDAAVLELSRAIIAKSPVAVETGKRMFYQQLERGIESAYDYASGIMACNMMAEDAAEGIDAFMHKRAPQWRGR